MRSKIYGNQYRTTVICVDSYENAVPAGRFYNPSLDVGEHFSSLVQFLLKMEGVLESMGLPQAFTTTRTFAPPPEHTAIWPPDPEPQEGKLATFAVRILFRQNASWQGSIAWLEEGREQSFRSVLELILLMDSALKERETKARKQV